MKFHIYANNPVTKIILNSFANTGSSFGVIAFIILFIAIFGFCLIIWAFTRQKSPRGVLPVGGISLLIAIILASSLPSALKSYPKKSLVYQSIPVLKQANIDIRFCSMNRGVIYAKDTNMALININWTTPDTVELKAVNDLGKSTLTVAKYLTARHIKNAYIKVKSEGTLATISDKKGKNYVSAKTIKPDILYSGKEISHDY